MHNVDDICKSVRYIYKRYNIYGIWISIYLLQTQTHLKPNNLDTRHVPISRHPPAPSGIMGAAHASIRARTRFTWALGSCNEFTRCCSSGVHVHQLLWPDHETLSVLRHRETLWYFDAYFFPHCPCFFVKCQWCDKVLTLLKSESNPIRYVVCDDIPCDDMSGFAGDVDDVTFINFIDYRHILRFGGISCLFSFHL